MPGKAARCFRLCSLACFLLFVHASPAPAAERSLTVPFEFSSSRDAILLHVEINHRPALLIFDTGAAHTVIRPQAAGISPAELLPTNPGPSSAGFIGDAVGAEVLLKVENWVWPKRRVAVMDLSRVLSAYKEKVDGVLGLDFVREFSRVTVDLEHNTLNFTGDGHSVAATDAALTDQKPVFGKLSKVSLSGGDGHYVLNGSDLLPVNSSSVDVQTRDGIYKVRVSLLKTVPVSRGLPSDPSDKGLVEKWLHYVPLIRDVLGKQDAIGSLKPVAYDLLAPKDKEGIELREEVLLLWSADPAEMQKAGVTTLHSPLPFQEQIIDVQYRGLSGDVQQLHGKAMLQILFLKGHEEHFLLGGFVIVSKANGAFEFYLVPRPVLDQIVVGAK